MNVNLIKAGELELADELVVRVGPLTGLGQPRDSPDDGSVLVLVLGLARRRLHQLLGLGLQRAQEPLNALHL